MYTHKHVHKSLAPAYTFWHMKPAYVNWQSKMYLLSLCACVHALYRYIFDCQCICRLICQNIHAGAKDACTCMCVYKAKKRGQKYLTWSGAFRFRMHTFTIWAHGSFGSSSRCAPQTPTRTHKHMHGVSRRKKLGGKHLICFSSKMFSNPRN